MTKEENSIEGQIKQLLVDSFRRVDADKSGFLEKHELEDVLRRMTKGLGLEDPSGEDVDFIMKELDINGDGKLSKEEFQQLVNQVLHVLKDQIMIVL